MRSRSAAPRDSLRHTRAGRGRGPWLRRGRLPIRVQLLLLVAVVALPFTGLLVYLTVDRAQYDLVAASAAGRSAAQAAANDVERLIAGTRTELEALAVRPLIQAVDPAQCDPLLADLRPLDPTYANVGVIDPAGRVVCSGVPLSNDTPVSIASSAGFQAAIASGTFSVGRPLLGPITHRWVAIAFVPLHGPDGTLRGLVLLPIDLARLGQQLRAGQPMDGRTVTIIDEAGTVVARSVDGERWVGAAGNGREIVDQVLAGHDGTVIAHGLDGVERAYGYVPIPVAGWYVYAGTPTSVALAPTRDGLLRALAISLVILVLVILLALRIARSIARPIEELAAATALGPAPQASSPVAASGSAEVADMASSFDRVVESRAVAESDLALRADMLASVNDAVLAFGDDLQVTYWNASAARIYGWSTDEAIGRATSEVLRSDLTEDAERAILDSVRTFGSWRGDVVQHRRDGTPIVIESATVAHHGSDGAPQYLSVNRDITDRQAVDDKLRRTAQRLAGLRQLGEAILATQHPRDIAQLALDHLDQVMPSDYAAVYLIDPNRFATALATRSKKAGVEFEGILNLAGAEARLAQVARGAILIDLPGELGTVPQVASLLAGGLRTMAVAPMNAGDTLVGFLGIAWPDGAPIPSDAVQHVGEVANVLAIALQTSALHEDVARHAAELEARVTERTTQLQEVNDELEAFTYTVSHDLRAPLRAMRGMSDALLQDYGPGLAEEGRDFAARIVAAGARMDGLIQDLLAYSRLSRTDVKLELVDLDGALRTALDQLQVQLSAEAAEVTVAPHLGVVVAHPGILVQVLVNLVGNAAKFVRPDEPARISVSSDEPAPGRIRVLVADQGIGIAAEYRARIFRVFERLHGQETYPGTGVGLAIVRKGVERMGGTFGVESDGSSWSRFWFELEAGEDERQG